MIFVTGGTGLTGSYLLYELAKKGYTIRALLRSGNKDFIIKNLFSCFEGDTVALMDRITWVEGDILDRESLQQAMDGVDHVYHCAALVSFDPRDYREMLRVNIDGTANVVNACLQNGVTKLCHISSIASLGSAEPGEMIDENSRWKTSRSNSGYAISKYGGEREVWRGIEEGLQAIIVNPSVIIGAGCHPKAVHSLFRNMRHFLPFYTQGVNGYVDVRDVVKAMILLMESDVSGERFVLSSENLSMYEFFSKAADLLGKRRPFIPVGLNTLLLLSAFEKTRSLITGKKALMAANNVRSACRRSNYSSEKFTEAFNFPYIPIKESLKTAFEIIKKSSS